MNVANPHPLPLDVLRALDRGHKIEAVKLLRQAEGIGLREARQRVEAHLAANPGARLTTVERPSGVGRWIALGVVAAAMVAIVAVMAA